MKYEIIKTKGEDPVGVLDWDMSEGSWSIKTQDRETAEIFELVRENGGAQGFEAIEEPGMFIDHAVSVPASDAGFVLALKDQLTSWGYWDLVLTDV